jgi:hypothetical protein
MASEATVERLDQIVGGAQPRRWWQWLLVYPAAATALLTAVPNWADKAQALYNNIHGRSYAESDRQRALWEKNIACFEQPSASNGNPANVRVNATVCPSGDVLIRVLPPYGRSHFEWVELDRILHSGGGGGSLIPEAHAASLTGSVVALQSLSVQDRRASYRAMPTVVAQRFLDQRLLLRHIRTPQGCIDEVIDTLNGSVVRRARAPCRRAG